MALNLPLDHLYRRIGEITFKTWAQEAEIVALQRQVGALTPATPGDDKQTEEGDTDGR